MSRAYERRAAAREKQRQQSLMGETLADFHSREKGAKTAPGAHLSRSRCTLTPSLFDGATDRETKTGIWGLFAFPPLQLWPKR